MSIDLRFVERETDTETRDVKRITRTLQWRQHDGRQWSEWADVRTEAEDGEFKPPPEQAARRAR